MEEETAAVNETLSVSGSLIEKGVDLSNVADKGMDQGFEYMKWIHTDAGIVAVILTLVCVYLIVSLFLARREARNATDKLYSLGVASVQAQTQVGATLEKVYQLIVFQKET